MRVRTSSALHLEAPAPQSRTHLTTITRPSFSPSTTTDQHDGEFLLMTFSRTYFQSTPQASLSLILSPSPFLPHISLISFTSPNPHANSPSSPPPLLLPRPIAFNPSTPLAPPTLPTPFFPNPHPPTPLHQRKHPSPTSTTHILIPSPPHHKQHPTKSTNSEDLNPRMR